MVDFSKKLNKGETEIILDPIKIYNNLDRYSEKSGDIRPAQREILQNWYSHSQNKKDIILKMNTGSGKTLTGLLILESRRKKNKKLQVYLCNDNHLVYQTINQAKLFGIETCVIDADNEIPDEALLGKKILVATVNKLFNGKTIFGLDNESVEVDGLILDDAHNSAEIIKDSMKIRITKKNSTVLYEQLFETLKESIRTQGEGTFFDILNYSPTQKVTEQFLPVPFWEWQDLTSSITSVISKRAQIDNEVKFSWTILRDRLDKCMCLVSPKSIEIIPLKYPIEIFGSYYNANQRIFMSATTATDSILIKDLEVCEEAIKTPLYYSKEKWSGEKMVIIPSMIEPELLNRGEIVKLFGGVKNWNIGVVCLAPGKYRTNDWEKYGAFVSDKNTLNEGLKMIRDTPKKNPLVLVNRYDGIDLPDNDCRVLVIDSLPSSITLYDKYLDKVLGSGSEIKVRKAQKIEQAMGRSVRADTDYSVIILTGPDLVKFVRNDALEYLSLQARKQIEMGMEFSNEAKNEVVIKDTENNVPEVLMSLMMNSFKRDEGWKQYYKETMETIDYSYTVPNDINRIVSELELIKMGVQLDVNVDQFNLIGQKFIDNYINDIQEKGWYFQFMASVNYKFSKQKSLELQKQAYKCNRSLLLPWENDRQPALVGPEHQERLRKIKEIIKKASNYESLWNISEDLISNLKIGVSKNKFENAMDELGKYLGFETERPDEYLKVGPDHIWAVNKNRCFAIEDKSEVSASRNEIYKSETGQMNNSISWVEKKYLNVEVDYFMVISTNYIGKGAGFNKNVRIIREKNLRKLMYNFKNFIKEFENQNFDSLSLEFISEKISDNHLNVESFAENYSEATKSDNNC